MTGSKTFARETQLHFLLGGHDLEMLEIRRLLERHAPDAFTDHGLRWGAQLSDYRHEIQRLIAEGQTPVAVELGDDMPKRWTARRHLVAVDHHGPRAGADQPSALAQVFKLLALPRRRWTRRHALVAANDIGHVAGLRSMGASRSEVLRIRREDRRAQGVSANDEAEALRAIAGRLEDGALTTVETRSTTSSAIADLMLPEMGGPGYANLLVVMPEQVAFFGDGRVVRAMAERHRRSWSGGALPKTGFWGAEARSERRRRSFIREIASLVNAGVPGRD